MKKIGETRMAIQSFMGDLTPFERVDFRQGEESFQQLRNKLQARRELREKVLKEVEDILMNPEIVEVEQRTKDCLEKHRVFQLKHERILKKVDRILDPEVEDVEQRVQDRQEREENNEREEELAQKINDLFVDFGQIEQTFQVDELAHKEQQKQVRDIQKSFKEVELVLHQIEPSFALMAQQIDLVSFKMNERSLKRARKNQLIDEILEIIPLLKQKTRHLQLLKANIAQKRVQNPDLSIFALLPKSVPQQLLYPLNQRVVDSIIQVASTLLDGVGKIFEFVKNYIENEPTIMAIKMIVHFACLPREEKIAKINQTIHWTKTYSWFVLTHVATATIQTIHFLSSGMTFINEKVDRWAFNRAWRYVIENTSPTTWIALGVISTLFIHQAISAYPLISVALDGYLFLRIKC